MPRTYTSSLLTHPEITYPVWRVETPAEALAIFVRLAGDEQMRAVNHALFLAGNRLAWRQANAKRPKWPRFR